MRRPLLCLLVALGLVGAAPAAPTRAEDAPPGPPDGPQPPVEGPREPGPAPWGPPPEGMGQPPEMGPGPRPPPNDPADSDVLCVRVDRQGRAEAGATIARAGVPSLLRRRDGTWLAAFQWFPEGAARPRPPDAPAEPGVAPTPPDPARRYDAIAVARSTDGGRTWSAPRTIGLRGLPERERFPFDPTLVELEDGRVRLYMTRNEFGPWGPGEPFIGSAVSADGQDFEVEEGVRFAAEGQPTIDAACAFFRGAWHLFVPCQDRPWLAFHAVSRDGLRFERLPEVEAPEGHRWLGCAVSDGRGLWFYGTGPGGVWEGVSADAASWTVTRLLPARVADPGVLREPDGALVLLGVGPPRPGTPSALRRPRPPQPRPLEPR